MLLPEITKELERALHGLRYGSIQLVIHDEKIVRIERMERINLPAAPRRNEITAFKAYLPDVQATGDLLRRR